MRITRHLAKVAVAAIATTSVIALAIGFAIGFVGQSRASATVPAAEPALLWLEGELHDNGGAFPFSFDATQTDWGLTIDAILALNAGGRGTQAQATATTSALAAHINDYITGESFGDIGSHYAGAIGKAMLAAALQGGNVNSFGGVDLEALSRAAMRTSGVHEGRFSDVDGVFMSGDFSNGFGQALNILALGHTAGGVPASAVDFLLAQQCPAGGFRLLYDGPFFPAPPEPITRGCVDDADADTDATSFALDALQSLEPSATTLAVISRGATWLLAQQDAVTGGFHGTGPTAAANSNTTGLAAKVLSAAGFVQPAALARDYVGSLQLTTTQTTGTPAAGEEGAIALNPAAFDGALATGIGALDRDQWRRATAQAVLALISLPRADPEPLTSARLLDTRPGEKTVDGQQVGSGLTPAGSTLVLPVAGRGGVPADAAAVVLNVTVDGGQGPGYITVFPCNTVRPMASSLNFVGATPVANAVVSGLAPDGTVCLYVGSSAANLIVDVGSYFPAASGYHALTPVRLLDTRPGESTIDGTQVGAGQSAAGSTLVLPVAGRGGVPADATSVVLNVTAAGGQGLGFVTVFACGTNRPLASNLNFGDGTPVANAVITGLSTAGSVCLYVGTNGVDLVADVSGYFPAGSGYHAVGPARLLDTRAGESTVDSTQVGAGLVPAGSTVVLPVAGRGGVPADATSVVLNVTAVGGLGVGFVTVFPCGTDRPLASNLNFVADTATPNAAIVKLSAAGTVCLFVGTNPVNLVADVSGYFG